MNPLSALNFKPPAKPSDQTPHIQQTQPKPKSRSSPESSLSSLPVRQRSSSIGSTPRTGSPPPANRAFVTNNRDRSVGSGNTGGPNNTENSGKTAGLSPADLKNAESSGKTAGLSPADLKNAENSGKTASTNNGPSAGNTTTADGADGFVKKAGVGITANPTTTADVDSSQALSPAVRQWGQSQQPGQSSRQLQLNTREGGEFVDYATRSALKGDPLSDNDMNTVQTAAFAVAETRSALPIRGNVREDMNANSDATLREISATRRIRDGVFEREQVRKNTFQHQVMADVFPERTEAEDNMIEVAITSDFLARTSALGVGNCDEFASITARNVAGNLSTEQEVSKVGLISIKPDGEKVDHVVAKIYPAEGSGDSAVIADAWANGSPVRERDAPATIRGSSTPYETFDSKSGQRSRADLEKRTKNVSDERKARMRARAEKMAIKKPIDRKNKIYFDEIQTTSQSFDNRSGDAARRMSEVRGPRQEFMAAVVGREDPDAARAVNNMVGQITDMSNSDRQATADGIAAQVRTIAAKDARAADADWLTIESDPNP